jgi:urease subunit alpha
MFGAYGRAPYATALTFVSRAALEDGVKEKLRVSKELVAVENVRGGISKKSMILNDATPNIEIDPETYDVRADGELLVCEPAEVLPMAQRYFLF